jgi:hypothetical protein
MEVTITRGFWRGTVEVAQGEVPSVLGKNKGT